MPSVKVVILGDASSLERAYKQAGIASKNFGGTMSKTSKIAFAAAGTAGIGALVLGLKSAYGEWKKQSIVVAETAAHLKSTGGIAGVTAKNVDALATALMRKSGVDDAAIQSGENMLLTFTKVRNEAGKGNDIFNQTTKALLDMTTTMTHGNVTTEALSKQAIQLGKAMNDPIAGLGALRRVGVSFTEQQKDQIKALVASGHTMDAQKIILRELNTEFGGSAAAIGKTLPGQINILKQSFQNLEAQAFSKFVPMLQEIVNWVNSHWPEITKVMNKTFDGIKVGIETAVRIFRELFPTMAMVAKTAFAGIQVAIDVAKTAFAGYAAVVGKHKAEIIAGLVAIGIALALALGPVGAAVTGAILAAGLIKKHWGAIVGFFKTLTQEITNAFSYAWIEIQRGAIETGLAIVKAFDITVAGHHLIPGVHSLVKRMQEELDKLKPPDMSWNAAAEQAGATAGDAWAKGFQSKAGIQGGPPGSTGPVGGIGAGAPTGPQGPAVKGGLNTSKWPKNAILAYTAGIQAGLTPAEAKDFAAVQWGESGFSATALNKHSGAAGLYQLLSSGYVNKANQLGGVMNPNANIAAILPDYVKYYKSHPNLVPGAAGSAVERSGEGASFYAAGYSHLGGGAGVSTTAAPAYHPFDTGPAPLSDAAKKKVQTAAETAKKKLAAAAAKAAAKIIADVHADAQLALEGTPKLGVDVGKLQKAWTALATTIAKPFQALAGKAANQVGYLQQLMGTEVPGRVTDYTTEITAQVNTQVTALEDGLAKLKARGMSGTAAASKLASQLNTALTSQEGLLQNAVQAARTVYDTAVSKFTTSFGKLAQDIVSQFQAQTAAHITELGGKFFQGSKTPAEAALSAMQAADTYSSLQDALNQAQESGDQKQIAMAQRALDEYNLSLDAVEERTKADQDYAAAVKTYTDQRATQEQALTDSLNKFGTGVANGKLSMDGLPALLKSFGINLGTGPGNATGVVALFAKDLKAATTDNGGIISSLSALQKAFDALVGWVNDKTGANISAGAVNVGGGGDAGAAIGGGGGGGGEGPAAGVAGGAAAYYQPTGYYQSGAGNYAKKPMLAGGGFINRSGLAYLHKGETVVPANGSGGNTVEIHVHGSLLSDERKLTEAVLSGLRREKTRLATLGLT